MLRATSISIILIALIIACNNSPTGENMNGNQTVDNEQVDSMIQSYNPPFTNGPWPGRPFPTKENPIIGMGGFIHDSLYSDTCKHYIGYSIVLPSSYYEEGNAEKKWPLIYFLHGRTGTECADILNSNYYYGQTANDNFPEVIMVFPNGMNETYKDNPKENLYIETHIIKELIPFINSSFKVDTQCVGIAGFSMGSSGAIKFHVKYPNIFNHAVGIDGKGLFVPSNSPDADLFGNYASLEEYNENSIYNLLDSSLKNYPGVEDELAIMMLCGEKRKPNNVRFAERLKKLGIEHTLITDTFRHDATLFYDKYIDQIIEFQKKKLCK